MEKTILTQKTKAELIPSNMTKNTVDASFKSRAMVEINKALKEVVKGVYAF